MAPVGLKSSNFSAQALVIADELQETRACHGTVRSGIRISSRAFLAVSASGWCSELSAFAKWTRSNSQRSLAGVASRPRPSQMVVTQHLRDPVGLDGHTDANRNGRPAVSLALWAVDDPLTIVAPRNLGPMCWIVHLRLLP